MLFDSSTLERFWSKVDKRGPNECWEWTASRKAQGYGRFMIHPIQHTAHRVSWAIHNGEIPDGKLVMHKCDNPPCVNPNHLRMGTNAQNMRDMKSKGRGRGCPGEKNRHASLTKEEVIEIRKIYKYLSRVQKYGLLARMRRAYCYPESTRKISCIVWRYTWKHI